MGRFRSAGNLPVYFPSDALPLHRSVHRPTQATRPRGIVTRRPLVQLIHTPAPSPPPDPSSLDAPSVPTHTKWGNAFSRQTVHDVDKIRKAFAESIPAAANPSRTHCVQNPLLRIMKIPVSGVKKYTELDVLVISPRGPAPADWWRWRISITNLTPAMRV